METGDLVGLSRSDAMSFLHCEGWWEQAGYGRQPMEQLRIEFEGGDIRG
jgi:hypothetical protein